MCRILLDHNSWGTEKEDTEVVSLSSTAHRAYSHRRAPYSCSFAPAVATVPGCPWRVSLDRPSREHWKSRGHWSPLATIGPAPHPHCVDGQPEAGLFKGHLQVRTGPRLQSHFPVLLLILAPGCPWWSVPGVPEEGWLASPGASSQERQPACCWLGLGRRPCSLPGEISPCLARLGSGRWGAAGDWPSSPAAPHPALSWACSEASPGTWAARQAPAPQRVGLGGWGQHWPGMGTMAGIGPPGLPASSNGPGPSEQPCSVGEGPRLWP